MNLQSTNRIIEEAVSKRVFSTTPADRRVPIQMQIADFDDVLFMVSCPPADPANPQAAGSPDNLNLLQVSFKHPSWQGLLRAGAQKVIDEVYGPLVVAPHDGYNFTVQIDLDNLPPSQEEKTALIAKLADIKRNILGAPLDLAFSTYAARKQLPAPIVVGVNQSEYMFISTRADSVVVVFSIHLTDKTDIAIAKIFLQEFTEAKRNVNSGPLVKFSEDKPADLEGTQIPFQPGFGYVSIVLFNNHVDDPANRARSVTLVQQFRTYLQYHIKCSKAYQHTRMRKRVATWLQVISNCVPDRAIAVGTKTASGRHFLKK
eukprot:gnl/Hemi2/27126_TR9110_c2_g1_i1.p2 gnl/Hemi2/27126_TR9110_c2_g1~~gnl/Hemi2/27126_TR9110_c2_g1_i1.p2  ORF type:complete len:316 (+),score=127.76 gnl/Hemi2/27126_TR9110_c2_g1_i1:55-1002(+)